MSKVFDVNLSNKEKTGIIGRKNSKSTYKNRSSKDNSSQRDDGFLGRFLHSDVLLNSSSECKSRIADFV